MEIKTEEAAENVGRYLAAARGMSETERTVNIAFLRAVLANGEWITPMAARLAVGQITAFTHRITPAVNITSSDAREVLRPCIEAAFPAAFRNEMQRIGALGDPAPEPARPDPLARIAAVAEFWALHKYDGMFRSEALVAAGLAAIQRVIRNATEAT